MAYRIDFIPDNDIAPARRMRIRKALEWGAVWVREFKDGISHIIVDKGLQYKDVLAFLKVKSLPVCLPAPATQVTAKLGRRTLFL